MAEHTTQRLRMRATPEQCFAVVTDFEHYPDWAADLKSVSVDETDAQGRAESRIVGTALRELKAKVEGGVRGATTPAS